MPHDDPRLLELVLRYEGLREQGRQITPEELCRDCPELLAPLRQHLAKLDAFKAAFDELRPQPGLLPIHIRCPHCRNAIEVVEPGEPEEVVCPSCGSSFRIDPYATKQPTTTDAQQKLGRYVLLNRVGMGAFGAVWKARDTQLDRIVALKVPRAGNLPGGYELDRFLREARSVAQLRHASIVSVHDVGEEHGTPFIVSDFVEGITLADLLTARRPGFREAAELIAQLANALQYAHDHGVVHRDVKPSNIMLENLSLQPPPRTGEGKPFSPPSLTGLGAGGLGFSPRLMDFGLAKRDAGEITMTIAGQVLGTPAYMSPEQARGEGNRVDGRTDVYSLGVILYELLTGELPFRGNTRMLLHQVLHDEPRPPRTLNDRIPRDLQTICLKAMAKEPRRRYALARELADDLRRWLKGEPITARPVGAIERGWRWCRRNRAAAALGATALITVVMGAVALVLGITAFRIDQERTRAVEARDEAKGARQREEIERRRAEGLAKMARDRAVRLDVANGVRLMDDGDLSGSLVWFADALRLDAGDSTREEPHRRRLTTAWLSCPRLTQVWFHASPLTHAEFNHDGSRLVSADEDGSVYVWPTNSEQPICRIKHKDKVPIASFNADGSRIVTASLDKTACIWDAVSGQLCHILSHENAVNHAAFSPDGTHVATASNDGTARIWDTKTGQPVTLPLRHTDEVLHVVFSPNGQHLVTSSADATARIWLVRTGQSVGEPLRHPGRVDQSAFSPDGRLIGTADGIGGAQRGEDRGAGILWDAVSGKRLPRRFPEFGGKLTCVRFSPDGQHVLFTSADRSARIEPVPVDSPSAPLSGTSVRIVHPGPLTSGAFSPDGATVALASRDGTARVWRTADGQAATPPLVHGAAVVCVAFSPDGRFILTASLDGTTRLWDLYKHNIANQPTKDARQVRWAEISPDGRRIAHIHRDETVSIRDVMTGEKVLAIQPGQRVRDVRFSLDSRLFGLSLEKTVEVWDVRLGRAMSRIENGDPTAVFSHDGEYLLTFNSNAFRLWKTRTGELALEVKPPLGRVLDAKFSPDGQYVALCQGRSHIDFWDIASREYSFYLKDEDEALIYRVEFSPDGSRVFGFKSDSRRVSRGARIMTNEFYGVAAWNYRTRSRHDHSDAYFRGPRSFSQFDRSGSRMVSVSPDRNSVEVWDLTTGERATETLAAGTSGPTSARFSSGTGYFAVTQGNVVRTFDANLLEPIATPVRAPWAWDGAMFSSADDGLLTFTGSSLRVHRLVASDSPASTESWLSLAELMSGRKLSATGKLVLLKPEELQTRWVSARSQLSNPSRTASVQAAWHLREAVDCEEGKDWAAAIWHIDQLLKVSPSSTLWARRGDANLRLSRFEAALQDYGRASGFADADAEVPWDTAAAYARRGDSSIGLSPGGDRRRPKDWRPLGTQEFLDKSTEKLRAVAERLQKDMAEKAGPAQADFRTSLQLLEQLPIAHPLTVQARLNLSDSFRHLADIFLKADDPRNALASFQESSRLLKDVAAPSTDSCELLVDMGDLFLNDGKYSEACALFQKCQEIATSALGTNPSNQFIRRLLAIACFRVAACKHLADEATVASEFVQKFSAIAIELTNPPLQALGKELLATKPTLAAVRDKLATLDKQLFPTFSPEEGPALR